MVKYFPMMQSRLIHKMNNLSVTVKIMSIEIMGCFSGVAP